MYPINGNKIILDGEWEENPLDKPVVVDVEYVPREIAFSAIYCPNCGKKFYPDDISKNTRPAYFRETYNFFGATFICPCCNLTFTTGYNNECVKFEEKDSEEIKKGVTRKKTVWTED